MATAIRYSNPAIIVVHAVAVAINLLSGQDIGICQVSRQMRNQLSEGFNMSCMHVKVKQLLARAKSSVLDSISML